MIENEREWLDKLRVAAGEILSLVENPPDDRRRRVGSFR